MDKSMILGISSARFFSVRRFEPYGTLLSRVGWGDRFVKFSNLNKILIDIPGGHDRRSQTNNFPPVIGVAKDDGHLRAHRNMVKAGAPKGSMAAGPFW